MRFSYKDRYLLSVSRDRSFSLFERSSSATHDFTLVARNTKAHTRIIWACSFTPDDLYFVTTSRDKSAKVWSCGAVVAAGNSTTSKPLTVVDLGDSVTAIDIAPQTLVDGRYVALAGLESGALVILLGDKTTNIWSIHKRLSLE